jgi:hypothetical protein
MKFLTRPKTAPEPGPVQPAQAGSTVSHLLPTSDELLELQRAAAVLAALAELLSGTPLRKLSRMLDECAQSVRGFAWRQPGSVHPAWFDVSVREHMQDLKEIDLRGDTSSLAG